MSETDVRERERERERERQAGMTARVTPTPRTPRAARSSKLRVKQETRETSESGPLCRVSPPPHPRGSVSRVCAACLAPAVGVCAACLTPAIRAR